MDTPFNPQPNQYPQPDGYNPQTHPLTPPCEGGEYIAPSGWSQGEPMQQPFSPSVGGGWGEVPMQMPPGQMPPQQTQPMQMQPTYDPMQMPPQTYPLAPPCEGGEHIAPSGWQVTTPLPDREGPGSGSVGGMDMMAGNMAGNMLGGSFQMPMGLSSVTGAVGSLVSRSRNRKLAWLWSLIPIITGIVFGILALTKKGDKTTADGKETPTEQQDPNAGGTQPGDDGDDGYEPYDTDENNNGKDSGKTGDGYDDFDDNGSSTGSDNDTYNPNDEFDNDLYDGSRRTGKNEGEDGVYTQDDYAKVRGIFSTFENVTDEEVFNYLAHLLQLGRITPDQYNLAVDEFLKGQQQ